MKKISIEKTIVEDIPLLTFYPADARRCPLVFFTHGFTGQKESALEMGYQLAQEGLFCAAPDAYRHGERLAPPLANLADPERTYIYPPETGLDTWLVMIDCALRTTRDLDALIDAFASDARIDVTRTGVTGFSMGGFVTYFAAARLPRISAAAPMGAYPELARRWRDFMLEAAAYPQWSAAMDSHQEEARKREAWLKEIEPCTPMLRSYRKPLMMVSGDQDTDAPKAYSVPFFGAMRALYAANPGDLVYKIFDGVAHSMTGEMILDIAGWFKKILC